MSSREARRPVPTPIVLAVASAMLCVGIVGYWVAATHTLPAAEAGHGPSDLIVDTTTPERAAESFLDAWRKRAHHAAKALSTGPARQAVEERAEADAKMSEEERALKEQVWDQMAGSRLSLKVSESDDLAGGGLVLHGTAEGTFLDRPYVRRVQFELVPTDDGWRVRQVAFGEILSDVPGVLEEAGGPDREPPEPERPGQGPP